MKRCLLWFVLWVLFSIGAIVAGLLTPFLAAAYPLLHKRRQNAKRVEAVDRMLAAFYFGCSGRWTLSIECAHEERRHMKFMRRVLNSITNMHCEHSAYNEGVFCEYPRKDDQNETS